MSDSAAAPEELVPPPNRLDDLLGYARAHAATGDTQMWVDDLEAWDLMTPEQKVSFREHPEVLALIEAAGA
jgi:hypothetical protein